MRRIAIALIAMVALLVASVAAAQTVKMKDGKYQVTTPQGDKMTIDQDGKILDHTQRGGTKSKLSKTESGSKTLKVGGNDAKEPRSKTGPKKCEATGDLLVEHAIISDADVGVAMIGSCDADVFNTQIDAKQRGIDLVGSGDLQLTQSEVRAAKVGVNVAGSGDAIIENAVIVGPVALKLTGSGNVIVRNSKVFGKVSVTGTGKLIDEGGNELVADHTKAPKSGD